MAVTGTGAFGAPMESLKTMISACSSFQTWVDADNASEALAFIKLVGFNVSGAYTRPLALIMPGNSYELESVAGGGREHFLARGTLELVFEDDVAAGNAASLADACLAFTNSVGGVISDLEALSGSGSYLVIKRISLSGGPQRSPRDQDEIDDYMQMRFTVDWSAV